MNVAMLCHASLGGSSRVATRLAYALERSGHTVSLVCTSPPPAPVKELTAVQLEPLVSDSRNEWTTVIDSAWDARRLRAFERHLASLVRRNRIDVVHYHYVWPFARLVAPLRARLGVSAPAVVATLHGTDVTHPPPTASLDVLADTDVFTTVSDVYAAIAWTRLGLGERPRVIPNFVELGDFPPSVDFEARTSSRSRPRIVHLSNYRAVKDPDGVAAVFERVRREVDVELWLAGEGPGLQGLHERLVAAGLGEDVRLLGYCRDVGRVLGECDVLLMTSLEESFCLAALEGMASGLAVVATRVGGLRDLAASGKAALFFEPRDYDAGAAAVVRVLRDRSLRLRLRAAARARARRFSAAAAVARYEQVYATALTARGRDGGRAVASGVA